MNRPGRAYTHSLCVWEWLRFCIAACGTPILETLIPLPVLKVFKEFYLGTAARNMQCLREMRALATALLEEGIPVVTLKGAFLIEHIYHNPGVRPMGDMDLLVPADSLEKAASLLAAQGYLAPKPLDTDVVVEAVHHLPLACKSGAVGAVEIHWNLTPPNLPYTVAVGEFWERCVPAPAPGSRLLALCPEDLLLHLCMHAAYMHEFSGSLRPFCDIAATIRHYADALAWPAVIERAQRWHWARGAYLALRLSQDWIAAAVPPQVLDALQPKDFDEALCAAAREQVFNALADLPDSVPSTPFTALWKRKGAGERVRILRDRLLPAKPLLARRYSVRPDSLAFYGCYPRHWLDLMTRYGPIAGRLLRGDAQMTAFVRSRERLGQWIAKP